jgi:uncharacterized protein (DUF934 family)
MAILKDNKIVEDRWINVTGDNEGQSLPEGDVIVPLALWKSNRAEFLARNSQVGVMLEPDQSPQEIADDLARISLVALNFPASKDGRAFTSARLLRDRYKFTGEIRAVGSFGLDQMFYLKRCGFDAYALPEGRNIQDSIRALEDFTVTYQAAADQPLPLYRRR